ncbi:MAG: methylated-DNA--[protein]-cysteine S-methyltransferase [Gemmatimonadota bacterium]
MVATSCRSEFETRTGFEEVVRRLAGAAEPDPGAPRVRLSRVETPVGRMVVGATGDALCLLEFDGEEKLHRQVRRLRERFGAVVEPGETGVTRVLLEQLRAYFAGGLRAFDIPLALKGTAFQEAAWAELRTIPYGETRSYGEQARRMGRAKAVRAVAQANGENPVAIVVPCHRVIGADGRLTGYGGGLWRKERLLDLERNALEQCPA